MSELPLHSPKVTVWCGVATFCIVGPYFFKDAQNNTLTVNSERYIEMLRSFLEPELQRLGIDRARFWFQQDGATAHTARATIAVLQELFPGRLMSRKGDIEWPPRSPDLNPCDYFLWGYLKSKVYATKPRDLDQLEQAIRTEVASIQGEMTERVLQNYHKRLDQCLEYNGGHLKDVIFKK